MNWTTKPETYKTYSQIKTEPLPIPTSDGKNYFATILSNRKSIRTFSSEPLKKSELAFLLWASTGIQRIDKNYEFRTAPSAGALYPIETYLVVNTVENLEKGVYHYNIKDHSLELLKSGKFGSDLSQAALGQSICATAAVVFVWTAIFERSKWKYAQRAYRYIYLDAGHIAENLALAATSISCGSCQIGAFFDDAVNSVVGVNGEKESTIYLSVVGHIV